jgi:crotonobetainyl-CoA:carnitine CoA-transferase CaiB-like acyl-CoA transferase
VSPPRSGPLAGLRIVSLEQFGAGPFATLYLADMGADVIRVEDRSQGGDVARYIPPGHSKGNSLFFETFNRGKRSICLDLKSPKERAVFNDLLMKADVLFSNLRGGLVTELELTFADLLHINRRLVCVSLTGYGDDAAGASRPGYDALIQADAGWAQLTGDPEGPPSKSGLSLVDYVAGLISAVGLLAAVLDARASGVGRDVRVNLFDSALAMLTYPATWQLSAGIETHRLPMSAHPSVVPFQLFQTLDGYAAVACPKEKFFRALANGLDRPDLATDDRFRTFSDRYANRDELTQILANLIRAETTDTWIARLGGSVPIAPVRQLRDVLKVSDLAERRMLAEWPHPILGDVKTVGTPIAFSDFQTTYVRAPMLDEHRSQLLSELGYSEGQIGELMPESLASRSGIGDQGPV